VPLAKIRTALTTHLTERREHRRLTAELAAFQSPAERTELDEMLARHSTEETREIRQILDRQAYERHRTTAILGGHHNRAA
jgi:hypothetical protein